MPLNRTIVLHFTFKNLLIDKCQKSAKNLNLIRDFNDIEWSLHRVAFFRIKHMSYELNSRKYQGSTNDKELMVQQRTKMITYVILHARSNYNQTKLLSWCYIYWSYKEPSAWKTSSIREETSEIISYIL